MTLEQRAKRYADSKMCGHANENFYNFYYNFICRNMTPQEARIVLSETNKWRRSQVNYDDADAPMPFSPLVFGQAIDKAIEVLDKELGNAEQP